MSPQTTRKKSLRTTKAKIIERICVVTPAAKVAAVLESLLAAHGYSSRSEPIAEGLRVVASDGRLALELIENAVPPSRSRSRQPTRKRSRTSRQGAGKYGS